MALDNSAKVLVFHSHGVGQLVRLPALPKEGETVWTSFWEVGNDGAKGSNVAAALGNLGISTAFIGKVGCDVFSEIGLDWLRRANVDFSRLIKDPNIQTQIGMVMVDEAGNNSIILGGTPAEFTDDQIQSGINAYPDASYLITGFEMRISDSLAILRYGKSCGKYTILNPSPAPDVDIGSLSFVDMLILNKPECDKLLQLKGVEPDNSHDHSLRLLEQYYSCSTIILTLGSLGYAVLLDGNSFYCPATPVEAVDTSGAGDSFLAAVTAALVRGLSLPEACSLAGLYATQTIKHPGTFPAFATLNEMQKLYPQFKALEPPQTSVRA